ncbi:MAG: hypothetical protein WBK11_04395, partial [Bacillota bacterium]
HGKRWKVWHEQDKPSRARNRNPSLSQREDERKSVSFRVAFLLGRAHSFFGLTLTKNATIIIL